MSERITSRDTRLARHFTCPCYPTMALLNELKPQDIATTTNTAAWYCTGSTEIVYGIQMISAITYKWWLPASLFDEDSKDCVHSLTQSQNNNTTIRNEILSTLSLEPCTQAHTASSNHMQPSEVVSLHHALFKPVLQLPRCRAGNVNGMLMTVTLYVDCLSSHFQKIRTNTRA